MQIKQNTQKLKLGIVGYGYWSPKVINGFLKTDGGEVFAICEKDKAKWDSIKEHVPNIVIYQNYEQLVQDPNIDAIVITTTVSSHYRIAKAALLAGKHVLVEKPMTEEVWQSDKLIAIAKKKDRTLMVDHTFLFMPAIRALKGVIDSGELGKVHTVLGNRSNLGLFQKDVDVVTDLAPHDFSILYYFFNEEPYKVIATGNAPVKHVLHKKKYNAVSSTTLLYMSGLYVHFIHSWLAPIKDRRMIFVGDKKMAVFDMLDQTGVLKIYDTCVNVLQDANPYGAWFSYTQGEHRVVDVPKLEGDDIQRMAQEFIDSIREHRQPITDGYLGRIVVNNLAQVKHDNIFKKVWAFITNIFYSFIN